MKLKTIKPWLHIALGCMIVAVGFVLFINPYSMVPGGVYGTSIILHDLFPVLQVGTFSYFLQIPLMLLSTLLLGKRLGMRTLFVVLFTPFVMNALTYAVYPLDAVQSLDASKILGGTFDLTDHMILGAVFGGLLVGGGSGLIIRNQAGTGGTDLVAMMMQKYLHVKFSRAILIVDGTIIVCGLIVTHSVLLSLYSLVAVGALNVALKFALNGSRDAKIIYIICDNEDEENDNIDSIYNYILNDLDLTATCVPCRGLYSKRQKEMLMMVVHDKMVPRITKQITEFDSSVFLIVADAYETFGLRWSKFPTKDDLMLG